jgi:hypothetical protein
MSRVMRAAAVWCAVLAVPVLVLIVMVAAYTQQGHW